MFYCTSACTSWFDRDNPGGNCDCEDINPSYPTRLKEVRDLMKTCKSGEYVIQAKLVSGTNVYENTEEALADTGNTIHFNYKALSDPDSEFARAGIICWNKEQRKGQRCKDFAVRFCCGKYLSSVCLVQITQFLPEILFLEDNKVSFILYHSSKFLYLR